MKKVLTLIMSVAMIMSIAIGVDFSALAATGQCGTNVTYSLNEENGTLTISGTGAMSNYYSSQKGKSPFEKNQNIKSVVIENGVTSVGDSAFMNCKNITSVTIPASVDYIGNDAFYNCNSLTEIAVPNSVTYVGNYAFESCDKLAVVRLGTGVKTVGEGAFDEDKAITDVYYAGSDIQWKKVKIYGGNEDLTYANIHYEGGHVHLYVLSATKDATCSAVGTRTYTCTVCGETKEETIPMIPHTPATKAAVAPTFIKTGLTEGTFCTVCGSIILPQNTVAKLGSPKLSKVTKGSKSFKATWKKVSRVGGYQIRYSTKKNMKSSKTVKVKGAKKTSVTVKKLKAKKTYYVQIRAYKTINGKKQYSKWSAKKTVKTTK